MNYFEFGIPKFINLSFNVTDEMGIDASEAFFEFLLLTQPYTFEQVWETQIKNENYETLNLMKKVKDESGDK